MRAANHNIKNNSLFEKNDLLLTKGLRGCVGSTNTRKSEDFQKTLIGLRYEIKSKEEFFNDSDKIIVLDGIVDQCYHILSDNVSEFKTSTAIKDILKYAILEYVSANQVILSCFHQNGIPIKDAIEDIAYYIFINQITPLIANPDNEIPIGKESKENILGLAKITDREREYLNKKGANIDYELVLKSASELVGSRQYEEFVTLSDKDKDIRKSKFKKLLSQDNDYRLTAVKCLISFQEESDFISRLDDNESLIEHIVKYRDHIKRTLFHYAVAKNKIEIVKAFCKIPKILEIINEGDGYSRAPLHLASAKNYDETISSDEMLSVLIAAGANVECKDGYGRTALHIAASSGNLDATKCLIDKVSVDSQDGYSQTPLHLAAVNGQIEVIKVLKQHGADVLSQDGYGRTPLHLAALNNQNGCITELCNQGANINLRDNKGNKPLVLAILKDKSEAVGTLYKINSEILQKPYDGKGNMPLHLAAQANSLEVLQFLLQQKLQDVDKTNNHGSTALHHAAYHGKYNSVKLLLEHNADPKIKDSEKRTPLIITMKTIDSSNETKSIISNKIRCAATLINNSYSDFIDKKLKGNNDFFLTKEEIPKSNNQYCIEEVHKFIISVYKFLKEEEKFFVEVKDYNKPVPLKMIEHPQPLDLLKKCPPELVLAMTEDAKKTLYDSSKEIEFHKILQKICPELYQAKKINCMFDEEELKEFLVDTEEFCSNYIQEHREYGVSTIQDVFTLALFEAIYRENIYLVGDVLSRVDSKSCNITNIFTSVVDDVSPIYIALSCGNRDLLDKLGEYIKIHSDSIIQVMGNKNDLDSIESLLERTYYRDNGKSNIERYKNILSYLYQDSEILEYADMLIGEDASICADFI